MSSIIQNAKILSTKLGYEEGILTSWLHLEYERGVQQGFGGYRLDRYNRELKCSESSIALSVWVIGVLKTVGVQNWDNLLGKPIRVQLDDRNMIIGIGHYLEDKWFFPRSSFFTHFKNGVTFYD